MKYTKYYVKGRWISSFGIKYQVTNLLENAASIAREQLDNFAEWKSSKDYNENESFTIYEIYRYNDEGMFVGTSELVAGKYFRNGKIVTK